MTETGSSDRSAKRPREVNPYAAPKADETPRIVELEINSGQEPTAADFRRSATLLLVVSLFLIPFAPASCFFAILSHVAASRSLEKQQDLEWSNTLRLASAALALLTILGTFMLIDVLTAAFNRGFR